jgi:hypothetical protein
MNYDHIPQEPEKRRVILVLSRLGLQQLKQSSSSDLAARDSFLSDQICLLDLSSIKDNSLSEKLRGSGLLNSGSVLIQSPYDPSAYTNISEASYTFAKAKCVLFATFCGLLAARKVSVKHVEIQTNSNISKISGNAGVSAGKGSVEAKKIAEEKMRKEISIVREYGQTEPKLDKALEYMSKYQWLSDDHINSLFDLRDAGIPIQKETYRLSITRESRTNLDIAFSLSIPTQVGLKVDISQVKEESFDFSAEFEVEFW